MARTKANGQIRRISVDMVGDDAVDLEILEASLGIPHNFRGKSDRDHAVAKIAFAALYRSLEAYRQQFGVKHPKYEDFAAWLGVQPESAEDEVEDRTPATVDHPASTAVIGGVVDEDAEDAA
ncbi:hypothetical protein BAE30_03800 [Acidithiobacillus caldus]|uniref:Phage protein n=1 Tax=Acidithiobacillus caldus TaxID=33059 RepID=A0A1E7YZM8_9PROT|nr:hypothetical protein BAE30_03800 [Acidithiobacillus caldus]